MSCLSMKSEEADLAVKKGDKEVEDLKIQSARKEQFYHDDQRKTASLMEEKEKAIEEIGSKLHVNALAVGKLISKLGEVEVQLSSKENEIKHLIVTQDSLDKEKEILK